MGAFVWVFLFCSLGFFLYYVYVYLCAVDTKKTQTKQVSVGRTIELVNCSHPPRMT